jgi:hypothetical protein
VSKKTTITRYEHHDRDVAVIATLQGKHRDHCLCFQDCAMFNPDDRDANCPIANALYAIDVLAGLVTPVWECERTSLGTKTPWSAPDQPLRFDENGPIDAFLHDLLPAVADSLAHGRDKYGDLWLQHMDPAESMLESASHVIEIHVKSRLMQALEAADFDDVDAFIAHTAAAVGLLAVAVCRLRLLQHQAAAE